jgi:hypothetical protein
MGVERRFFFSPQSSHKSPPHYNSKELSVMHFGGNKETRNGFKASRWLEEKDS